MMKKIFLMTVFFAVATPEKINTRNDNQAAAVLVGAGVLGTALCWAMRESNSSVVARANQLLEQNNELLKEVDDYLSQEYNILTLDIVLAKNNINFLADKLSTLSHQLSSVYSTIKNRHDSSLAPWNWSQAMLQARNKLESVVADTEIKLQKLTLLLDEITYSHKVILYQALVQDMAAFMASNKNLVQQIVVASETIYGLEQVFSQKKLIQKDLNKFFENYKSLDGALRQRVYSLNPSDRNQQLEKEFNVAYQQTLFLNEILKYSDCIININNETALIRQARKAIGASSYPIKDFVNKLGSDINDLLNASLVLRDGYAQFCIETLQDLKNTIIASNEYVAERHAYEIYLEQRRQVEAAAKVAQAAQEAADAAQRQARAAEESADAAYRQARAAEEQNRLKKEENRIKQERNNIERNKQQQDNRNNNDRW